MKLVHHNEYTKAQTARKLKRSHSLSTVNSVIEINTTKHNRNIHNKSSKLNKRAKSKPIKTNFKS